MNIERNERVAKAYDNVIAIQGGGKYCMLITFDSGTEYSVIVCDEVGTVLSTKQLNIEPDHISMTDKTIVITDHRNVYIYILTLNSHEENHSSYLSSPHNSSGMERMFDIHDTSKHPSKVKSIYSINNELINPRITAVCATPALCLIAKEDNNILVYSLPNITKLNEISLECCVPRMIQANCDSTKFSIIDNHNIFQILDLEKRPNSKVGIRSYLRSTDEEHIWAMRWSADDPDTCVIMDEGKVTEIDVEDVINKHEMLPHSNGYLIDVSNMEVTLLFLEEIMSQTDVILDYCIQILPSKALEEARTILMKEIQNQDLLTKFPRVSHKLLWKLVAFQSLEKVDFATAGKAFILAQDHAGLVFTEDMTSLNDQHLQQAEAYKFIGRYNDAEKFYLDNNRFDLAIQMNVDVGDWSRVTSLIVKGRLDNSFVKETWFTMAEYFANRKHHQLAAEVCVFFRYL